MAIEAIPCMHPELLKMSKCSPQERIDAARLVRRMCPEDWEHMFAVLGYDGQPMNIQKRTHGKGTR